MTNNLGELYPSHLRSVMREKTNVPTSELLIHLRKKYPQDGWNDKLLEDSINWCQAKHRSPGKSKTDWDIRKTPGGKTVRFIASTGLSKTGQGVVGQITEKVNSKPMIRNSKKVFGVAAGSIMAVETAHIGKKSGRWSIPDLVIGFRRGPRARQFFEIHAIEIEERSKKNRIKASPQQVAQAYVAGRGADRCWLMFHQKDLDSMSAQEQERIEWASAKLGVGLITFADAGNITTWKLWKRAKPQRPDQKYKKEIRNLIS